MRFVGAERAFALGHGAVNPPFTSSHSEEGEPTDRCLSAPVVLNTKYQHTAEWAKRRFLEATNFGDWVGEIELGEG